MSPLLISKDSTLVRKAMAGSTRSMESLVLRYHKKACAVARAICLDPQVADDVVQEALLLALQNLSKLRVQASFGPWLLQIVRNVARRTYRQGPLRFTDEARDIPSTVVDEVDAAEFRDALWREVRRLPDSVREAIFLYYHEGNSVRQVARAQQISTAAAKKRLQAGRDLLRERLWRGLREYLRDMLPSARGWKARGRQLALVVIAAGPASSSAAAVPSSAGKGALSKLAVTGSAPTVPTTLGVIVMNKIVLSVAVATPILLGTWALVSLSGSTGSSGSDGTSAKMAPDTRQAELETELKKSRREIARLTKENQRLQAKQDPPARELPPEVARVSPPPPKQGSRATASGIDWTALSELLVKNKAIIAKLVNESESAQPGPGEQAQLMAIMSELMKNSAEAKKRTPYPLLNSTILAELTTALFQKTLKLTEAQSKELASVPHAVLEEIADANPAELAPLERYRLRREVSAAVHGALEEVLTEAQRVELMGLKPFSEGLFEGAVQINEYGIDIKNVRGEIAHSWKEVFHLREDQMETVDSLATNFLAEGRQLLEQKGGDEKTLDHLDPEARRLLDEQFFDLQSRYEQQIEPLLDEEQLRAYLGGAPRILRLRFGKSAGTSQKSGVF